MKKELLKSFCFPYNGDYNSTIESIEQMGGYIYEIYGTDDKFKSSRSNVYASTKEFSKLIRVMRDNDIEFNYLLNSFLLDNYIIKEKKIIDYLKFLKDIGVRTITLSSPYFLDKIKALGFNISTSIIQKISTETSIKHHSSLGYDRIILDEDVIRNINQIKKLRKSTNLSLEIIVNSGCLKFCPFRMTHWNVAAISHPSFTESMRSDLHKYCKQCKSFWGNEPVSLLKSLWIRPEEILKYKKIGVDLFKIGGRSKPGKENLSILKIYAQGSWEGSIFDYLKPNIDPEKEYGLKHIMNKDLDEFFNFFFENKIGCQNKCKECMHCYKWEHLVKKSSKY